MDGTALWAWQVAQLAPLPDRRLHKRLAIFLQAKADKPDQSIPQVCGNWADTKATYRFLDNRRMTQQHLLSGFAAHTATRAADRPELLAIQDTTSLNLTRLHALDELGPIDSGHLARGLLLHSTLAVTPQGQVLGLLGWQTWVRPRDDQPKPEEKESAKWLHGLDAARSAVGQHVAEGRRPRLIHVMDREGDYYDAFQDITDAGDSAVIRCAQDRVVAGDMGRAHAAVRSQKPLGRIAIAVPRKPGQAARQATAEVRSLEVTLTPDREKYPHGWPLTWWRVEVYEPQPPEGVEALLWRLWTRERADTLAAALRVVGIYQVRWRIEDYHLTLKSGCQAEQLRVQSWEGLQKALLLYSVVATRVLELRDEGRQSPERAALEVLSEGECEVLVRKFGKGQLQVGQLRLGQAVLWIGRLGGHLNRKGDGMPGVRTLWRGLQTLADLVTGFRLAHQIGWES